MGQLVFTVKCPDGVEAVIEAALEAAYGKPSQEVIEDFIREVYAGFLVKAAVTAAQAKATGDAAAVVIGDKKPVPQPTPAVDPVITP